ncbi:hypothetical protein EWM64_g4133 [Hericium alpestre]|uniref:DUF4203 domain-containing protein n=1 Tax=Hericium alpestre TaxID=135208 RepID=A0A4Z0A2F6_9AGAM|nr:hypothetical protein EWM64_g4133 [Hericium alpestre]
MSNSTQSSVPLAALLPTLPYTLAYGLPLLLLSLPLTFAGAFLTVDRTFSFAPHDDVQLPGAFGVNKTTRKHFYLEGGVGGLAVGWIFGLFLSSFLALVIPNESASPPLSAPSFVVVWLLSAISTCILSGRFKYASLLFAGITGGTTFALALVIGLHPALSTRRILLALFICLFPLMTLLPFRTRLIFLRISAASTGAFGLILFIALMAHADAWGNVWERLWVGDGAGWGTSVEHGMSAGYWLLLIGGFVSDWLLHRVFGGNPDQKWDKYLAEYTSSLPHDPSRAGIFTGPTHSISSRVLAFFHIHAQPSPAVAMPGSRPFYPIFPSFDADGGEKKVPLAFEGEKAFEYERRPAFLRKPSQHPLTQLRTLADKKQTRKRDAVKFSPIKSEDSYSDSDDDETKVDEDNLSDAPPKPLASLQSISSRTLNVGSVSGFRDSKGREPREAHLEDHGRRIGYPTGGQYIPEGGPYEEDVTNMASRPSSPTPLSAPGSTTTGGPITLALPAHQRRNYPGSAQHQKWDNFWRDVTQRAGEGMR